MGVSLAFITELTFSWEPGSSISFRKAETAFAITKKKNVASGRSKDTAPLF